MPFIIGVGRSGTTLLRRARLDEVKARYRPDGTIIISKERRLENQRFTSFPPELSRTFRWKREMIKEEKREFENVAGELLDRLDYER